MHKFSYTQSQNNRDTAPPKILFRSAKQSGMTVSLDPDDNTSLHSVITSQLGEKTIHLKPSEIATAMSNLKENCEYLRKYAHYKKLELPEKPLEVLTKVASLGASVANTAQYNEFHRITSSVFAGITTKERETVADFFYGCTSVNGIPGCRHGCRPECAGNLPYPGYDKDSFCDNHVGIYSSGKLSVTFSPPAGSNTIRIYHTDQIFYLSKNEFEDLKSKGINKAVLILTEGKKQIKVVTVENIATLVKENGALFKGVQLAGVENKSTSDSGNSSKSSASSSNKNTTNSSNKNSATKSTKTSNSTTDKSNKSSNKTQKNNNESGKHCSPKKHNNDDSWNGGFLIIAILIIIIIIVIIWVVVKCFYGGDSYNNYQNTDIGLQ
jgi:hypothetical protein